MPEQELKSLVEELTQANASLESDSPKYALGLIEEAEQKFLNETKTSPQEYKKMMEFVSDLPPRVMRELEKLEPYEFFLKAKELYDAQIPL